MGFYKPYMIRRLPIDPGESTFAFVRWFINVLMITLVLGAISVPFFLMWVSGTRI